MSFQCDPERISTPGSPGEIISLNSPGFTHIRGSSGQAGERQRESGRGRQRGSGRRTTEEVKPENDKGGQAEDDRGSQAGDDRKRRAWRAE
ncbi:MAG: hypothetical protein LBQ58_07270 [Synergistaceae bacterium]|nr:hypothetical protein [Synergistaceae bacterium]